MIRGLQSSVGSFLVDSSRAKLQTRKNNPKTTATMVVLEAAAITLAGVGAYKGGQAASEDIQKKARRFKTQRDRAIERKLEKNEREQKAAAATTGLSVQERLNRFKQGVPGNAGKKKRFGLFKRENS